MPQEKLALISVSDKSNLEDLLKELSKHHYNFISTGGTAKHIKELGFEVTEVSTITEFPEFLGGRVKTLHPKIHGGILASRDSKDHLAQASKLEIPMIDLVVVNLYPFAETIAKSNSRCDAIENIDIGGPAMLRSAAKNHDHVTVVSNKEQYQELIKELEKSKGTISQELRSKFAAAAFEHTANYDALIAKHLNQKQEADRESFSPHMNIKSKLRYGENPHQNASLYTNSSSAGVANAIQLQGKELSFNNYMDLDAAWTIVNEFDEQIPCVSIIKHTNPCGVAIAPNVAGAYIEALSCDTVSAFGGIVASNQTIDLAAANEMTQIFLEAIIAPDFTDEAKQILATKKNLRLLTAKFNSESKDKEIKTISGGYLLQDKNDFLLDPSKVQNVTKRQITDEEWIDLLFAWKVVKHVKSNAIVAAKDGRSIGIGVGQTNRVGAMELALRNIDLATRGAVIASDAFFPFRDSVDLAAQHHISAIIQPGGSMRDEEVIKACDELNIAMVFTNYRHFKH